MSDAGFVAYFKDLLCASVGGRHHMDLRMHTLAKASNPRLCPSTVSILCRFAKRLLPSMTNATCLGMGPCRSAPIRSSRSWLSAHSAGGEESSQFRSRDMCRELIGNHSQYGASVGGNYNVDGVDGVEEERVTPVRPVKRSDCV